MCPVSSQLVCDHPLVGLGGRGQLFGAGFWEEQGQVALMTHVFVTGVSTSALYVYFPSVIPAASKSQCSDIAASCLKERSPTNI